MLLRGGGAVAFVGLSAAALKLPFFSVDGAQVDSAACVGTDISSTDKRLIISNWPAYIDPRRKNTSTATVFEETTGITVDYTPTSTTTPSSTPRSRTSSAPASPSSAT